MAEDLGITVHSYKKASFSLQTKDVNEKDHAQQRLANAKKSYDTK